MRERCERATLVLEVPAELKFDLFMRRAAFVLDVDRSFGWERNPLAADLDPKTATPFNAVSESTQLRDELFRGIVLLDIPFRSLLALCQDQLPLSPRKGRIGLQLQHAALTVSAMRQCPDARRLPN